MSCLNIGRVTDYCLVVANSQKLKYSSPVPSASKIRRLRQMLSSDDPRKRAAAAGNPMLPDPQLWELGESDPSVLVRQWVTRNPKCGKDLLEFMANNDPDPTIRAHAGFRLEAAA